MCNALTTAIMKEDGVPCSDDIEEGVLFLHSRKPNNAARILSVDQEIGRGIPTIRTGTCIDCHSDDCESCAN
ncbi:MAG: hypothetical protein AUJ28_00075 [Parcubacteria group bacterium CG1_02_37_51]|uniref:Uncharacterized protein n=1 Tax=Candidatus Komeilibacteria bacterium CG_4_10_14_0_8_um_filter_37_78 TaxID=1974471 RepID=A0A2M7RDS2_9BACT|nr:MAG: hypothetical protein AUJ28_00075 [Parcubacteria group bacterium CG1_02_37_51]PIY94898.1 MAG: hypothetical protein COY67_01790 [Candidatus Komeilibacteria bacterium CG_4_10_14_0_8_um_filter_37_78]